MKVGQLLFAITLLGACNAGRGSANDAGQPLPSGAVVVGSAARAPPAALPAGPAVFASAPVSFAELAAKADPAVVYVKTVQTQGGAGQQTVIGEGLGSAFVYDAAGYILTNHHVIENATEIHVTFSQNLEMPAKVVGRDPPTDIAVLRVEATGLAHLTLGDSDATRVGDWVVAIGNPFGLTHTVSAGIVSAKGRTGKDVRPVGDTSGYYNFIQTDASINPGNSGGPLLDMSGRVVGINHSIRKLANNIGFAIPINMVRALLPRLIKDGEVRRSFVGVKVDAVKPADVERLKLPDRNGALVTFVFPGGPADRAGLKQDDLIQSFQGEPMLGPEKLRWVASLAGVDNVVTLRVRRGPRVFDLKVKLVAMPDQKQERVPSGEQP